MPRATSSCLVTEIGDAQSKQVADANEQRARGARPRVHGDIEYLVFAVKDAAGKCAGGDIRSNSEGKVVVSTRAVTVPAGTACTAEALTPLAGH